MEEQCAKRLHANPGFINHLFCTRVRDEVPGVGGAANRIRRPLTARETSPAEMLLLCAIFSLT